jgi:hypothetical protein
VEMLGQARSSRVSVSLELAEPSSLVLGSLIAPPSLHRPIPPALHILIPPYRGSFPSLVRHTNTPPHFGNPQSRMHCLVSAAPTSAACAVVKRVGRRRLVVECAVSSTNDGEPAPRRSDLFLHASILFTVHNLFASITRQFYLLAVSQFSVYQFSRKNNTERLNSGNLVLRLFRLHSIRYHACGPSDVRSQFHNLLAQFRFGFLSPFPLNCLLMQSSSLYFSLIYIYISLINLPGQ